MNALNSAGGLAAALAIACATPGAAGGQQQGGGQQQAGGPHQCPCGPLGVAVVKERWFDVKGGEWRLTCTNSSPTGDFVWEGGMVKSSSSRSTSN